MTPERLTRLIRATQVHQRRMPNLLLYSHALFAIEDAGSVDDRRWAFIIAGLLRQDTADLEEMMEEIS